MHDDKRTLECLKKGARIASQCLDTGVQVQLYVELLNQYIYYFERGNGMITVTMLNQVYIFMLEMVEYIKQYTLICSSLPRSTRNCRISSSARRPNRSRYISETLYSTFAIAWRVQMPPVLRFRLPVFN